MLKPLDLEAQTWVEKTLATLSDEELVGSLLCPDDKGYSVDDWLKLLARAPLGSVFFDDYKADRVLESSRAIQKASRIPVLIAGDFEGGLNSGTLFGPAMASGAAGDPALALSKGLAIARQARSLGFHWTFSPVVDLNFNPNNPETNVRAFGDDPDLVQRLAEPLIRGLQSGGLAATAKHFPGGGSDDRDQHLSTTINPLPLAAWWATYGRCFRAVIDQGVYSIMPGHIAFPAYEGLSAHPNAALPATLSPALLQGLLRDELGFEGLVVSDAVIMGGICSRVHPEKLSLEAFLAGNDVILFADPVLDFERLLKALKNGMLPRARAVASARRLLELKARLGLHLQSRETGPAHSLVELPEERALARTIAQRSITLMRNDGSLPLTLKPKAKVLTVTCAADLCDVPMPDLTFIDAELKQRGFEVDHLLNPGHQELLTRGGDYERIFFNIVYRYHQVKGTNRMVGAQTRHVWQTFWKLHPHTTFTAFGQPYHLYEMPHVPNFICAYSPDEAFQTAAVAAWLGEEPMPGRCPVTLPRF